MNSENPTIIGDDEPAKEKLMDPIYIFTDDDINPSLSESERLLAALKEMGIIIEGELGKGGMGTVCRARLSANAMKRQKSHENHIPNMRTAILNTVRNLFPKGVITEENFNTMQIKTISNSHHFLGTEMHPTTESGNFAIKVIPDADEKVFQRSIQEAQKLSSMQTVKGLPRIFATMCIKIGNRSYNCICMEELAGETFERFLDKQKEEEKADIRLQLDVAALLTRACNQFAEHPNATHRDIKPANFIVGSDGSVRMLDLGLVMEAFKKGADRLTQEGATVGTLRYMAPEQIRGSDVSPKADVYSLGIMLIEMFTTKHPYGEHFSILNVPHIIKDLQENFTIDTSKQDDPEMKKFVDTMLVPFLKLMIQEDPSLRPGMDEISEKFRTWSSFGRFTKSEFREDKDGKKAILTDGTPKIFSDPSKDTIISNSISEGNHIPSEDIEVVPDFGKGTAKRTQEYNFLDHIQYTDNAGGGVYLEMGDEESVKDNPTVIMDEKEILAMEEDGNEKQGMSKRIKATIVGISTIAIAGVISILNMGDNAPKPEDSEDNAPKKAVKEEYIAIKKITRIPENLGEKYSFEYKESIAKTLMKAIPKGKWDQIDIPTDQWNEESAFEADGTKRNIVIDDMELVMRKDGNVLLPIPTTVAGQKHIGSQLIAFIDGKQVGEPYVQKEIIYSEPSEKNPNINAFYNVRFEGIPAGKHLSVKAVHNIETATYESVLDTEEAIAQLLETGQMSEEEWDAIEEAFTEACNIVQDNDVSGTDWRLAEKNNMHGDCGVKAAYLREKLQAKGFEVDIGEGAKLNTDLGKKKGNHAVVICKVQGGTIILDPEKSTRNYIGPLTYPYLISTLGVDVDVTVPDQSKPHPKGGFSIGHWWKVNYDESMPIRRSDRYSGDDSDVVQEVEEQLFK